MARDKYTVELYDFGDKRQCVDKYIRYMLNRTNQMFEYDGLPETINERQLELHNQINGYTIWFNIDEDEIVQDDNTRHLPGGLYALYGGLGGVIDLNGDLTWATIAHPRLKESKRLKIGEECVVMRNDSLMMGLLPLYERYATQLMENDITMNMADIESRIVSLMTAGNDKTKLSADLFMADIIKGKFSIITDKSFSEDLALKTLPYANNANNTITNLIELHQYIKASLYNEIGLSANYNMKRESINSGEAQLGKDSLLPLVDDMLHSRQEAVDEINRIFGTNIEVHFHSAWAVTSEIAEQVGGLEGIEEVPEAGDGSNIVVEQDSNAVSDEQAEEAAEETEGTEDQEDYNRNLQKRAKRGKL